MEDYSNWFGLQVVMAELPQYSDPEKDAYAKEKTSGHVGETPVYGGDERIGENEEYGEVKELRYHQAFTSCEITGV